MRGLALLLLLAGVAYGAYWYGLVPERLPEWGASPKAQAPRPSPRAVKDCRDACEQRAIVDRLSDEVLRACRATCEGPSRTREPIRSVTRAPADHGRATSARAPADAPQSGVPMPSPAPLRRSATAR